MIRKHKTVYDSQQTIDNSGHGVDLITGTNFYNQIEQLLIDSSASSQVWDEISSVLKQLVPFDRMVIASTDVPRGLFSPFQISGISVPGWDSSPVHRMGESLIGEAVKSSTPVQSNRIGVMFAKHGFGDSVEAPIAYWKSTLGMRIVNGGEIIGAIVFLSHTADIFGSHESEMVEKISRMLGPFLSHQMLQKKVLRATEHQTNLEYLLKHLNDSQDPATFFNTFYSAFAARASLVFGALFAYERYSDTYIPIANIDGTDDTQNLTLERTTRLVNEHRLSGESVHLACEHKSVPASPLGTSLMETIRRSPDFRELCLIPLKAGTNRVGAIVFAMSDCNPSMLERVHDIESAGPIASAYLQLHQTSRQWDRQQHLTAMLQYAVEGLCEAQSVAQKLSVFEDTMIRVIGAFNYSIEITHRVTGVSSYQHSYHSNFSESNSALPDPEVLRVNSRLGDTHIVDVAASFAPGVSGLSARHELRAVVRVCASILGTSIISETRSTASSRPQHSLEFKSADFSEGSANAYGLTARESEILKFLTQGASNDEIAIRCGLASGTVKNRLVSIYKKLGVRNRSQASLKALGADRNNQPF